MLRIDDIHAFCVIRVTASACALAVFLFFYETLRSVTVRTPLSAMSVRYCASKRIKKPVPQVSSVRSKVTVLVVPLGVGGVPVPKSFLLIEAS